MVYFESGIGYGTLVDDSEPVEGSESEVEMVWTLVSLFE